MKTPKGLIVNYEENAIIITKDFAKRAKDRTSLEYKTIRDYRKDGFEVRNRTAVIRETKYSYKGWTITKMREYVEHNGTAEMLVKFNNIVATTTALYNGRTPIGSVRSQFTELYPKFTADEMRDYIESEKATFKLIQEAEVKKVVEYPNSSIDTDENQAVNQ